MRANRWRCDGSLAGRFGLVPLEACTEGDEVPAAFGRKGLASRRKWVLAE